MYIQLYMYYYVHVPHVCVVSTTTTTTTVLHVLLFHTCMYMYVMPCTYYMYY